MISLTIDVRGATNEQLQRFGEIAGMKQALHELLYRSRGHEGTTITVLGGGVERGTESARADFLSIVAAPGSPSNDADVQPRLDDLTDQVGC